MKKKLTEEELEPYRRAGRLGGIASFKSRGKKGMSAMGKKGAKKRWSKK